MFAKIRLSKTQMAQIAAFNRRQGQRMIAFNKAHPGDRTALMNEIKIIRKDRNAFMQKTLTKQQYARYNAEMKAAAAKMSSNLGHGAPGGTRRR
jgi:hypothetical protein